MLSEITPLILTFNEAPNLRRTLERLTWAREIVVVDSFSTDETAAIARSFPQVRVVQRKFDSHADQWNFGLDQTKSDWVLALDADYTLSEPLVGELRAFEATAGLHAYFARFIYCVSGRPLRGTLYPPRAVLFRKDCCRYEQDGHTQRLRITGATSWLKGHILHDDRKPLDQWLQAQDRYARLECKKLSEVASAKLGFNDRLRRQIIFAPAAVFVHTLLVKGLILDGWPGWFYVAQRVYAELLLSLRLLEARLNHVTQSRR
jgi:glycosyltransferase involved in cell wall biosynthesis